MVMKKSRGQFGAYLVERKLIDLKVVDLTLQNQTIHGGRFGTNLVEVGALSLDEVEEHLAAYFDMKRIPDQVLDNLPASLIRQTPKAAVERYFFLPLEKKSSSTMIASMDPEHERYLEEVSLVLGTPVRSLILSEVRLSVYLDHYFKIPSNVRFRRLYFNQRRSRVTGKAVAQPKPPPRINVDLANLGMKPLAQGEELTDEGFEEFLLSHEIERQRELGRGAVAVAKEAEPTPPPKPKEEFEFADLGELPALTGKKADAPEEALSVPSSLEGLDAALGNITDRPAVGALAISFARQFAAQVTLFVVQDQVATGWVGHGTQWTSHTIRSLVIPLMAESIFQTVAETKNHYVGPLAEKPLNENLRIALSIASESPCLVVPIFLKKRLVTILVAENQGAAFSKPAIDALLGLGRWLPKAYETLIARKKKEFRQEMS